MRTAPTAGLPGALVFSARELRGRGGSGGPSPAGEQAGPLRRLRPPFSRPHWIVVAAEPITDVDTTAADLLAELDEELNADGTSLVFAELKDPVKAKLERYELVGPLDPEHFFRTLEGALDAYREQTGAEWRSAPRPTPDRGR